MLYGSNTLVVFSLTFDSLYTYTRLGCVDDTAGLTQAPAQRAVRINYSNKSFIFQFTKDDTP